jgi:hypothetical protein
MIIRSAHSTSIDWSYVVWCFHFVKRHLNVRHAQAHNGAKHATMASSPNNRDYWQSLWSPSTVFSRFFIKTLSNDAARSLNQDETSKNGGGLKRWHVGTGYGLMLLTIENKEPCMFIELPHDVISLVLMYLIHRIMAWLEESVKLLKMRRNLQRPATMHAVFDQSSIQSKNIATFSLKGKTCLYSLNELIS